MHHTSIPHYFLGASDQILSETSKMRCFIFFTLRKYLESPAFVRRWKARVNAETICGVVHPKRKEKINVKPLKLFYRYTLIVIS